MTPRAEHNRAAFDRPADVLRSPLSRDQKIRVLEDWERDLRELLVADEENMTSSTQSPVTLQDVRVALAALDVQPDAQPAPTKHG